MVYKVYRSGLPALSDCKARTNVRAAYCEDVCVCCFLNKEMTQVLSWWVRVLRSANSEVDPESFLNNNAEK